MPEASATSTTVADGPPFPVEPSVLAVLDTLWSAGHGGYLVGGGVRDALLGLPVSDWDVATDARPRRLLEVFPGASYQNRFGTVLARGVEITTFRRDHRYADHRRPDAITFSSDIFEDLARRDLTINAIAWGRRGPDAAPRLVDPADGQGDLEARLVRAVGDPSRRFDEDALRLLRAVRIAARLDFDIEPMTYAAMVAHVGDIEWVSEERVGSEVRRMLAAPTPSRAMRLLRDSGILDAAVPELAQLPDTDFARSLAVLDEAAGASPGQERLALAALCGNLGPAACRSALERLRVGSRDADAVVSLVVAAGEPYAPDWSDAAVRRYMGRVPPGLLDDALRLRSARVTVEGEPHGEGEPRGEQRERELRERVEAQRVAAAPLALAELAVDGRDLRETLGLPEGPLIGRLLQRLLEDVLEEPALNERTTLLTRASLVLDEIVQRTPGARARRSPIR